MSIFTDIKAAKIAAMKARDSETSTTLATLLGDLVTRAKNDGVEDLSDAVTLKLVAKFADNVREMRDTYARMDNIEAARKKFALDKELTVVEQFLPAPKVQLTEHELTIVVSTFVKTSATKPAMKDVMAFLKAHHEGQYDGKQASSVVKSALA